MFALCVHGNVCVCVYRRRGNERLNEYIFTSKQSMFVATCQNGGSSTSYIGGGVWVGGGWGVKVGVSDCSEAKGHKSPSGGRHEGLMGLHCTVNGLLKPSQW